MRKRRLASTRKAFRAASPSRIHENSSRALGCAFRCLILVGACVLACCSIDGDCVVACVSRAAHVRYAGSCFRSVGCGEVFGQNFAATCFEASDLHSRHPNASGFCYVFGSRLLPNASAELVLISRRAPFSHSVDEAWARQRTALRHAFSDCSAITIQCLVLSHSAGGSSVFVPLCLDLRSTSIITRTASASITRANASRT